MKCAYVVLLSAAILFVAVGCGGTAPETTTQVQPSPVVSPISTPVTTQDEFAATRKSFSANCAVCHGETGEGGTVKIEDKTLKVPNLGGDHARHHSDEELIDQITNGGDSMPPFKGKLTSEQINDLVRFIRHEFQ